MTGVRAVSARLRSGMPVVALPRPDTEIVTVAVAAATGSRNEPLACSGYAHLVEHLLCADNSYARGLQDMGGSFNASTRADRTVYYATAPARSLQQLLTLEAQRFSIDGFEAKAVARQTDVVAAEIDARFHRRAHSRFPMAELRSLMFAREVNRRDRTTATVLDAKTATTELGRYFATRYSAPRLALAMVGDIDPDRAVGLATDIWESVPNRAVDPSPALDESSERSAPGDHWAEARHAAVAVGFRVPVPGDLSRYLAVVMLAEFLAECTLRNDPEYLTSLAFGVDLTGDPLDVRGPTGLVARALVRPGSDPEEALKKLESLVRQTASGAGTTAAGDAFRTARTLLSARIRAGLDDNATLATLVASRLCGAGRYDLPEVMERIETMEQSAVGLAGASLGRAYRVGLRPEWDSNG